MKDSLLKRTLLQMYRKAKKGKIKLEEKYTKMYIEYCRINPQKLVFSNFLGKGYGDNPKYIAEEILRQGLKWDLIWLTNDLESEFPESIKVVKYGSLKAKRELASAKVWIDNVRNTDRPPKKEGQIYLQTWHGGFAIKKVEGAVQEFLNEKYVLCAQKDGKETDAIISACKVQTEDYSKNFWLDSGTEILEIGQPRNDFLFKEMQEQERDEVKKKLGISGSVNVVLYAPTFRDDLSLECYNINTELIKRAFENRFGGEFVILIRLHPNVQWQEKCFEFDNFVINATTYPDIQELYAIAEYLITDYSSSAFDFSLLKRPVFLYLPDYNKYKITRGLAIDLEETPFVLSKTNEELVETIEKFSEIDYWKEFEKFQKEYWVPYDVGNASVMAVKWIKEKIKEKG